MAAITCMLALGISAGTAEAASPYTHNNYYSYAGLYQAAATGTGVIANEYNNTSVTMLCYTYGQNVTDRNYSNYTSAVWFRVRDPGGRVGYVHSSYVQSQVTVGSC